MSAASIIKRKNICSVLKTAGGIQTQKKKLKKYFVPVRMTLNIISAFYEQTREPLN